MPFSPLTLTLSPKGRGKSILNKSLKIKAIEHYK
jgi:hypothetical protein